jgi:uncharacterized protein YjbJ (UPF0337 family)
MNWDIIEGKWKQFSGEVQTQWGKLTNDDLDVIAGNKEKLAGLPSERLRGGLARACAGVSGSRPRTAVSDIKEQETRATQPCTVCFYV